MGTKRNILIAILIVLLLSTGLLLYRSFTAKPLSIVTPTVSSQDVIIRSEVDALKIKLNKDIKEIDTGGSLDKLAQSKQFQEMLSDSIPTITVGNYGRPNPFIPPQFGL